MFGLVYNKMFIKQKKIKVAVFHRFTQIQVSKQPKRNGSTMPVVSVCVRMCKNNTLFGRIPDTDPRQSLVMSAASRTSARVRLMLVLFYFIIILLRAEDVLA